MITTVDPRVDREWERLAATSPRATLFHAPAWIDAVASTYGLEPRAMLLHRNGEAVGGVVHVHLDDALGKRTVIAPFSDFTDPLVSSTDDWRCLGDALLCDGTSLSMRVRDGSCALSDARLLGSAVGMWHVTDVDASEEQQRSSLQGSAKRNIRHALASGVTVEVGTGLADVLRFYELHCRVRKYKYHLLPQPREFFEAIHRSFAPHDAIHVLLARYEGRVIGGVLAIAFGDTLYYKFNASDLDELQPRPNDLLAWETIALARRLGLRHVDFGFSDADQPGLIRYKDKFATSSARVWRLTSGVERPLSATALLRTLGEVTQLFTDARVPDEVMRDAGRVLYRYFA